MADKIIEILESGRLEKVANVCESEKARTINLFNRVWGVGPASADAWYNQVSPGVISQRILFCLLAFNIRMSALIFYCLGMPFIGRP